MSINRRNFMQDCALASLAAALPLGALAASQSVKYGGSAWLGHYPAYLAMSEGYLKEAGIEQDWQMFGTSSARMTAVMSGGVDIACTGIVSALALMSRGARQFSIIAIPENFGRVEGIVARNGIRNIADLKGKKLGVTFASSAHLLVLDVLDKAGLKPVDVAVLNVPAPELPAAMQAGQIDAAAAWTPQFDSILRQPGVTLLADDTKFSLYESHKVTPGPDVLVVRKAFAEKNKDLVKAYLKAYFRSNELLRLKPEEAARALTKLTQLAAEDQMASVKGAEWYTLAQQAEILKGPYMEGLQKLAELLVKHKQIDKAPVVKDWIDASFIAA
jgi:taurine transport system substrate-binding protein